ncbi:FecR family protein [Labrys wisconsinensis]|uniref:Ferric-dicitrate binding protein FerR (Iron transport regulator) n=1 Tax=Labrys wisconsinensis TaxID=425677 RepID=A0ABU0JPR6_9HYPH|nr:FecR family protein [Labrys wisconsinensis]MDQ0475142.1 ferric-dicitrate binding protein FerR (iron transport regulator) [Labrys wisconsinensis]
MLIDRRSVLIGVGLMGISPLAAQADLQIIEAGTVEAATGTSTGVLRGQKRTLAVGAKVFIDDTLGTGTGARLGVRLGEATRLLLGERTRVRIDKFLVDRGGDLVLERGAMLFDRPDEPQSGPLDVATPFGLIAARGTKFFAGPSEGSFGVFVEHGVVNVRTHAGAVELTAGLGTDIRSIKAAPSAPKPWSDLRIAQAQASVT